jgi:uncharacterized tellurite resistance protein B-like protein
MDPRHARAVYELMMITAWADGWLDASEALVTEAAAGDMDAVAAVPDKAALAQAARQSLESRGLRDALRAAAAPLDSAAVREAAFVCCARVLEADGVIAQEEFQVLGELKALFGLEAADVARLLRVRA